MIEQNHLDAEEWLPVVDEDGTTIGKELRSGCHDGSHKLHPVVHLHVVREDGAIFLQKRAEGKRIQPGKWDTAVGGHIAYGETPDLALLREASEEIGLTDFAAKLATRYLWQSDVESELVYAFVTTDYNGIAVDTNEVDDGRFWTRNEIVRNLDRQVFTPNFEYEFSMLAEKGWL